MKKITNLILSATLIAMSATSCSQDKLDNSSSGEKRVITITGNYGGDDSRLTYNGSDNKFYWDNEDNVTLWDESGVSVNVKLVKGGGTRIGIFSGLVSPDFHPTYVTYAKGVGESTNNGTSSMSLSRINPVAFNAGLMSLPDLAYGVLTNGETDNYTFSLGHRTTFVYIKNVSIDGVPVNQVNVKTYTGSLSVDKNGDVSTSNLSSTTTTVNVGNYITVLPAAFSVTTTDNATTIVNETILETDYLYTIDKNVVTKHTLSFIADPAEGGTVSSASQEVHIGAAATAVTATAKSGFTFDGWYNGSVKLGENGTDANGNAYSVNGTVLTVTNAQAAAEYTAKFVVIPNSIEIAQFKYDPATGTNTGSHTVFGTDESSYIYSVSTTQDWYISMKTITNGTRDMGSNKNYTAEIPADCDWITENSLSDAEKWVFNLTENTTSSIRDVVVTMKHKEDPTLTVKWHIYQFGNTAKYNWYIVDDPNIQTMPTAPTVTPGQIAVRGEMAFNGKGSHNNHPGYTFEGWFNNVDIYKNATGNEVITANTAILLEGTGTQATYYMPASNVITWAKYTANTYTVEYNGNGSTGGSTASSTHTYNVEKALTANGFSKTGYAFAGWATSSTGAVVYADKASVKNLSATNGAKVTLYAKWTQTGYTLTYIKNTPISSGTSTDNTVLATYNNVKTIGTNIPSAPADVTVSGIKYTFAGWSSSRSMSGFVSNSALAATTLTANKTYYAVWEGQPEDDGIYLPFSFLESSVKYAYDNVSAFRSAYNSAASNNLSFGIYGYAQLQRAMFVSGNRVVAGTPEAEALWHVAFEEPKGFHFSVVTINNKKYIKMSFSQTEYNSVLGQTNIIKNFSVKGIDVYGSDGTFKRHFNWSLTVLAGGTGNNYEFVNGLQF